MGVNMSAGILCLVSSISIEKENTLIGTIKSNN